VERIERAVSELSPQEFLVFGKWFEDFAASRWDERLEADVAAGKLDGLAAEALRNYRAGRCTEL
jgi:hypothetical protein